MPVPVPVPVWASLEVTKNAERDLAAGVSPPDESHHFLVRRQSDELVDFFNRAFFSCE